jgi:AbrB family looped-hinge helix DNA binding protein
MHQTSMSKKGQVVIPAVIRRKLNIVPATKLQVSLEGKKVIMTPLSGIDEVYGMFEPKGRITKKKIKRAKKNSLQKKFKA